MVTIPQASELQPAGAMSNYIGNKFGQQDVDKLVCVVLQLHACQTALACFLSDQLVLMPDFHLPFFGASPHRYWYCSTQQVVCPLLEAHKYALVLPCSAISRRRPIRMISSRLPSSKRCAATSRRYVSNCT